LKTAVKKQKDRNKRKQKNTLNRLAWARKRSFN